jgi:hypothetical protein
MGGRGKHTARLGKSRPGIQFVPATNTANRFSAMNLNSINNVPKAGYFNNNFQNPQQMFGRNATGPVQVPQLSQDPNNYFMYQSMQPQFGSTNGANPNNLNTGFSNISNPNTGFLPPPNNVPFMNNLNLM